MDQLPCAQDLRPGGAGDTAELLRREVALRDLAGIAVLAAHASDGAVRYPACRYRAGPLSGPDRRSPGSGADGVIPEGGRCQAGFGLVVCDGYGSCGVMGHHRVALGMPTSVRGSAAAR
jgi:hypothetical protein